MSATVRAGVAAGFVAGMAAGDCVAALFLVVGLINPRFVATRNLQTILLGNAYIAVAAIGMSMVIVSGNIDISVGSLIGVLATVSGTLAVAGVPLVLAGWRRCCSASW